MNTILFVGENTGTRDTAWHTQDHWELVYCTDGSGTAQLENGTAIHYRAGELVVIPPRERYTNTGHEGFTNICVTMANPSFPYRTAFRVVDDEQQSLKMAFSQAQTYYTTRMNKRELVLTALGELIAGYIVVFRSNSEFSEPVERIRIAIAQNYFRTDFALDEVIREMPFHYDYLRKLFKKEVGVSPLEYMTNLRMKSAETLLTAMWTNEHTISEIAQMCGFEDALYFSRVFKKYYGCAPSNFAKRRQAGYRTETDSGESEKEMGSITA